MNIILKGAGEVQFGMGIASGENRSLTAARKALSQFPAKTYHSNKPAGLLFLITTHDEDDCTFEELTDAADLLHDHLRPFNNIEYVWAHRMTPYIKKGKCWSRFMPVDNNEGIKQSFAIIFRNIDGKYQLCYETVRKNFI